MPSELPRLFLARHGDTAWTETRQHTGRTDLPLNEQGEDAPASSASGCGASPSPRVFTSPLAACLEDVRAGRLRGGARVDPDLVEWDYGRFEGMLTRDILKERPGWELYRDGCPGGESPGDVAARADGFIARVRGIEGTCWRSRAGTSSG